MEQFSRAAQDPHYSGYDHTVWSAAGDEATPSQLESVRRAMVNLEAKGYLRSTTEHRNRPFGPEGWASRAVKVYRLTDAGRQAVADFDAGTVDHLPLTLRVSY